MQPDFCPKKLSLKITPLTTQLLINKKMLKFRFKS